MFQSVCFISLISVWISTTAGNVCKDEPSNYAILGSKTAYDVVRGNDNAPPNIPADCSPVELYMLLRHGSRTSDQEGIQHMKKTLPLFQNLIAANAANGTLCSAALDAIKAWTQRMTSTDDLTLGELGKREMKEIGQRYRGRFPSLLNSQNASYYNFRSTSTKRTVESAISFAEGVTGKNDIKDEDIITKPLKDDQELKFYDICDKYIQTVRKVKYEEVEKFEKSSAITEMVQEVNKRIGLHQIINNQLSLDDVDLMYEICRYDYALFRDAPWCKVFAETDLKAIEYKEDLKYYWRNGYKFPIVQDMTCPLRRDILEVFEKVVDGSSNKPAFRFAHTTTLMTLFSSMGLFKDTPPLTADNMASQGQRKWRSSVIDPFSTNIAFALYKCGEDYKVTTMVNERVTKIPGCSTDVCTWDEFYDVISRSQLECNFENVCDVTSGSNKKYPCHLGMFGFLIAMIVCNFYTDS